MDIDPSKIGSRIRDSSQLRGAISFAVATLFFALFALSCEESSPIPRIVDPELEATQVSVDLVNEQVENGVAKYQMTTPLREEFALAKRPYTIYPKGLQVVTFNDTTHKAESYLRANYVREEAATDIWEARGNVVGRNITDDRTLYTEQLFWDRANKRIYSQKQVRIVQGNSIDVGDGFEADEGFKNWTFRRARGRREVNQSDTSSAAQSDSTVGGAKSKPDFRLF